MDNKEKVDSSGVVASGSFPFAEAVESLKSQRCRFGENGTDEPERRTVDWFGREEINAHLQRFLEHCAVNGIGANINLVIDWLYGKRKFSEPDEFVRISRMIEMVKGEQIYPRLILQVLQYALDMENQCRIVVNAARNGMADENVMVETEKLGEIIKNVL